MESEEIIEINSSNNNLQEPNLEEKLFTEEDIDYSIEKTHKWTELHNKTDMRKNLNKVTKDKNLRSNLHPLILKHAKTKTLIICHIMMLSNEMDIFCYKQGIDITERKLLYDNLFEKYLSAIIMDEEDQQLAIERYRQKERAWLLQYPWNEEEGITDYL